jgi:hypothetical protein
MKFGERGRARRAPLVVMRYCFQISDIEDIEEIFVREVGVERPKKVLEVQRERT